MTMLTMIPDDVALLIYKQIFNDSLLIINKPKSQRNYGFSYQKVSNNPCRFDNEIDEIIDYLNNNIIQNKRDIYDESGWIDQTFMDYYIIDNDDEKILISEDQYDEDYDKYYRYVKDFTNNNEISKKVIEVIFNLKENAHKYNWCDNDLEFRMFISIINKKIVRSNLKLRLSQIDIPDDLPIEAQALLWARQPVYTE